jgi:hypothetical protein
VTCLGYRGCHECLVDARQGKKRACISILSVGDEDDEEG